MRWFVRRLVELSALPHFNLATYSPLFVRTAALPPSDEEKKDFVSRIKAQVTLSFDHRCIDGGAACCVLKRVIELRGEPKKTLLSAA